MLLTVAELPEYLRAAGKLLSEADRRAIVDHLAAHPKAGVLIEARVVFASCDGRATAKARAAACG